MLCIVLLFVALIPQLVESVATLVSNMDSYVSTLQEFLRRFESGSKGLFGLDFASLANLGDRILEKISSYFSDNMESFVGGTANVGRGVFDLVIAFILAVYFLLDKRRITGGVGKFMALIMKPESFTKATEFLDRCNVILIRYISVDVIDGLIVGVVNFYIHALLG